MITKPVLELPKHITSLASSGVLISVAVSAWGASKQDRRISDEVAANKKADPRAVRAVRDLLSGDPTHKRLMNHRQTVYNWLRVIGYPWAVKQYYVPGIRIPRMKQEYDALKKQHKDYLDDFVQNYQSIVSNAAFNQGEMFDRNDYPDPQWVRSRYSMELYTSEVPTNDFRVQVSHDLAEDLFNSFSKQTEALVDRILSQQAGQLITVLESLSHCCDSEIKVGKGGEQRVVRRKIYDTTVQKALELCNTFREFNLTENPHLEQARAALQATLTNVPLEALKESDAVRAQVKSEVDDILSKFRPVAPQYDEDEDE